MYFDNNLENNWIIFLNILLDHVVYIINYFLVQSTTDAQSTILEYSLWKLGQFSPIIRSLER